jgi:uncharacterized protein
MRRTRCRTPTWPSCGPARKRHLLAAGPLLDGPDGRFRGLSILNAGPEQARQLTEQDPAVHAGRFSVIVLPWMVPAGAISFSPTRFPRSAAEVHET